MRAGRLGFLENCKPEVYCELKVSLVSASAVTFNAAGSLTPAAAINKAAACRKSFRVASLFLLHNMRIGQALQHHTRSRLLPVWSRHAMPCHAMLLVSQHKDESTKEPSHKLT